MTQRRENQLSDAAQRTGVVFTFGQMKNAPRIGEATARGNQHSIVANGVQVRSLLVSEQVLLASRPSTRGLTSIMCRRRHPCG